MSQEEPQVLEGVTIIHDVDVLCGRGGAALRHPGNQTYRRLVNLNKGLYITCLKTEKLKISRSIVAAIREQKGRFLEKDSKNNTWYDIGDKKAVEKTSQALREGQPKLRQKIVEMGGGGMGAGSLMERQYCSQGGIYPDYPDELGMNAGGGNMDGMLPPATATQQEVAALAAAQVHRQQSIRNSQSSQQQQSQPQHQQHAMSNGGGMHPPPDRNLSEAELLQRLSLAERGGGDEFQQKQHPETSRVVPRDLRPSINMRGSGVAAQLGFTESQLSLMSEFSAFQNETLQQSIGVVARGQGGGGGENNNGGSFRGGARGLENVARSPHAGLMPPPNHSLQQSIAASPHSSSDLLYGVGGRSQEARQAMPAANGIGRGSDLSMRAPSTGGGRGAESSSLPYSTSMMPGGKPSHFSLPQQTMADRRQVFAHMKYSRPPSHGGGKIGAGSSSNHGGMDPSGHSIGDEMPEIHMVESQLSLMSNITDHNSRHMVDSRHMSDSKQAPHAPLSSAAALAERRPLKADGKIEGSSLHSTGHSSGMDIGSRHSMMSGLSRISDTSIDASIFSDLSKKIGNVSTRSIAMSEMSAFDTTVHGFGDTAHERAALEGEEDPFALERVNAADFDA